MENNKQKDLSKRSLLDNNEHSYINFLRGLAIFLMLWGHSLQYCCGRQFDFFENTMFKLIYSFHMPLFMLISGYLFRFSEQKREMLELIEYKSKSLLYPILMGSILNLLLTACSALTKVETLISSLWFLWSVLACSIALALAMNLSKSHLINLLLIIIGFPFVALFPNYKMNLYMYPYFVIGYLYARNKEKLNKANNVIGIISVVIFIIMQTFFEKKHFIYISGILGGETILESIYIDLFRWAIGLFGSIAVIYIFYLLQSVLKKGAITNFIEDLGKDSLAVYILSTSLLSFWLPKFANKILGILTWVEWNNYIWFYNLIITPLVAIAYSILLLIIIKGLKKVGAYRLIFGR